VSTKDSLTQSMSKAKKRYSSLFRLPSDRKVLLLLALVSMVGGFVSAVTLIPLVMGMVIGLPLAFSVFLVGLTADYIIHTLILTKDTIYNLRRTMAVSLFSWGLWLLFILLGMTFAFLVGLQNWWLRFCLLGFSAVLILRLLVFSSTSEMGKIRVFAASFLEPFFSVVPFLVLWSLTGNSVTLYLLLFIIFAVLVGIVSTFAFLYPIDRIGERMLGMRSFSLFRAFVSNWVLSLNAPFEKLLERLGEKKDVETSFVKFASKNFKTILVIPSVHPGPFKNIGSSLLPSSLKASLEREINCTACVPHGLLGHEFDLASQEQNRKVIDQVTKAVRALNGAETKASPFVKVTNGLATACCQVFGKFAMISFTLAPKTIEDLPEEVGIFVRNEAKTNGLDFCAVVNAHNSIDGEAEMEKSMDSLKNVARQCLTEAVSLKQLPFEVGAATVLPKEFSLEDGMGAGGITVVIVKTGVQKSGYVVIDGNNMVSGLREEILDSLAALGIDNGEVLTTDTHSVSALILGKQGYHPVGEAMDRKKLVDYIKNLALAATAKLEPAEASCKSISVADVTVLGGKQLETLCLLIDKSLQTAKRIVVPVFLTAGLVLMSVLLFL
jgi:putative membrane protein